MGALYKGVELRSRNEVESEIATMRVMVEWLGDLAENLEMIFCDSKAGSCYTITLKPGCWNEDLRGAIRSAGYITGGHNGIQVEADEGHGFDIDPDRPGDWIEEFEAECMTLPSEVYGMALPAGFLDRLREKVKLSDVASKWVTWDTRKCSPERGDYWAPCPFHDETSSSFHIDDRKGYYYCFGCHAKGDIVSLVREKQGVDFGQAVRQLAFVAGMDRELAPHAKTVLKLELPNLLQLKDLMVENFDQENFLEVGVLTGWTNKIRNHDRLLRSLSWGDPDYPGNVLDLLTRMDEARDGSVEKLQAYIEQKFATEAQAITEVAAFSAAKRSLGYNFVQPRNDIIGVMMPFGDGFSGVYEAIKAACSTTPLLAKRADEVWNSSVLINDILELINHSAVVICDLTGRNENVFYELGIAHAWGKPVIPITQKAEDVPFDLRHHRYLTYLNNGEGLTGLQSGLAGRLQSLVGKKPWF